jgi:RNA polymerase sigma-70 factor (ECF subfamily)
MPTDKDLVGDSGKHAAHAFGELVARHGQAVYRFAFVVCKDPDDAQDLVQETFLTAWRKRESISYVDGSALPWLLVVCRNNAMNLARRRLRHRTESIGHVDVIDNAPELSATAVAREQAAWVEEFLAALPAMDRQIVQWCLIDEGTYADAASRLGMSEAAVTKRVQRLRERIRGERSRKEGEVLQ